MELKYVTLPAAVLLIGSFAITANAGEEAFKALDGDGDGHISAQEAEGHEGLMEHWKAVDANGDDKIDEAEFSAFEPTSLETTSE